MDLDPAAANPMQKRNTTFYQMLGLQPEVTSLEIKRAYRRLAKSHHPDIEFSERPAHEHSQATEFMARLNEAYETLIDKSKRDAYDHQIGLNGRSHGKRGAFFEMDDGESLELYLRQNFHPGRQSIVRVLKKYNQELRDLSLDIYDDQLVQAFERYADEVEDTLRKASNALSDKPVPSSLRAAVQMMRYSIAQAVDGLEEMRRFCQNYDYNHLHMAGNLFREATNLSRKAMQLSKGNLA